MQRLLCFWVTLVLLCFTEQIGQYCFVCRCDVSSIVAGELRVLLSGAGVLTPGNHTVLCACYLPC